MSGFALVQNAGEGAEISLDDGKVTVGRGPFLRIVDKRVSRHHAIIEVSSSTVTIQPIHTNPTFYKAQGASKFEPLEKDVRKELHNGDFIAFLPNDVVFEVKEKGHNIESCEIGNERSKELEIANDKKKSELNEKMEIENNEMKSSKKEANKTENNEVKIAINEEKETEKNDQVKTGVNEKIEEVEDKNEVKSEQSEEKGIGNNKVESEDEDDGLMSERTKTLEVGQLLKKTRNLPSWMIKKQNETANKFKNSKAAEGEPRKSKPRQESTETVTKKDEVEEKCSKTGDLDEIVVEKEETHSVNKIDIKEKANSRKRKKSDISDDDGNHDGDDDKALVTKPTLPACPYGKDCYRKNPAHFQEYCHVDQPSDQLGGAENSDEEDLPECPYGTACYRKNPQHLKDYKHIATPKRTRERRAKKKTKIKDGDDSPDDYDYNDSFIDDETGSSCEPSDESDWQPDNESGEEEDVSQLVSEANSFAKNKKMLNQT